MILGISIFVIIIYLIVGAVIGWLAGVIMQGKGFGFFGNVAIAIVGSILGGIIFKLLGFSTHGIWNFVSAVGGAVVLVWIINLVRK
ncbi:MAG: GlsB/YeaQ/YmgE family stress response membrane protein [Bacteroidota bacterium]|nr:GlsB/YeaQ/YmgE family stress response membrane protein [Bacteroidota bacterium]